MAGLARRTASPSLHDANCGWADGLLLCGPERVPVHLLRLTAELVDVPPHDSRTADRDGARSRRLSGPGSDKGQWRRLSMRYRASVLLTLSLAACAGGAQQAEQRDDMLARAGFQVRTADSARKVAFMK